MNHRPDHPEGFTYAPEGSPPQVGDILFLPISGETISITDVSEEALIDMEFEALKHNYGAEHLRRKQPETAQEKIDRVIRAVEAAANQFIGKCNVTQDTLEELKQVVLQQLEDFPREDDNRFRFAQGDKPGEIVPDNFYTAMRMYLGDAAPSWEQCREGHWELEDGTTFTWVDGTTYVKIAKPLNTIELTIEAGPVERKTVELFWNSKGRGALVEHPGTIDWDKTPKAFAELVGVRSEDDVESATLYYDEWIGKVAYTWGLAGAAGACFRTYQLPGVSDDEVAEARLKLKRDGDVVGRIRNVKIVELVAFDCPRKTPELK